MALLQRTRILPNERLDLPDFNNIESFICADFKAIHKNAWASQNFVFQGFQATGIGTNTLSLQIANSSLIVGADDGALFIGSPILPNLQSSSLTPSVTNYIEVYLTQDTGGADSRAFWDPTALGGAGAEFSQIIDTYTFLKPNLKISTLNFTGNPDKVKICEVDVNGSGVITAIRDRRDLFFRLGRGTNVAFSYVWNSRTEPLDTSFSGADKDITNLKAMFDALMDGLREAKGTAYWYQLLPVSLARTFRSTGLSILSANPVAQEAKFAWSGTAVSITDNNLTPSPSDVIASVRMFDTGVNLQLSRQDGINSIPLADGQILWVQVPNPLANVAYTGVGALATNYRVTNRGSVPLDDSVYWLAYREGTRLYLRGLGELKAGESQEIEETTSDQLLAYIGAPDDNTAGPVYSSNNIVSNGDSLTTAIGKLDSGVAASSSRKLIAGGIWNWVATIGGSPGIIAQNASFNADLFVGSNVNTWVAQSFQPTGAGTIDTVKFKLRFSTAALSGNAVCKIYSDSAGSPGTLLGTSLPYNTAGLTNPAYQDITFTFSSPVAVSAATTYYAVIDESAMVFAGGANLQAKANNPDSYASGSVYNSTDGGATWNINLLPGGVDLFFEVHSAGTSTGTLTNSALAYIQIAGQADNRNQIQPQVINLNSNDQIAYVTPVIGGVGANNLTVSVADISAVPTSAMIIARRVGNDVLVGTQSMLVVNNSAKALDGGLSEQIKTLIGGSTTPIDESTATSSFTTRGSPERTIDDTQSILDAQASMDAEIDKFFGQFRVIPHETDVNKVRVTGAERTMKDGTTITQTIKNRFVDFDGAVIDFATGQIFKSDGFTVLGNSFTPFAIPLNQYLWYAISIEGDNTASPLNQTTVKINVAVATGADPVPANAVFPSLDTNTNTGAVLIKNVAGTPTLTTIKSLGVGSGSGGGGGGTALLQPKATAIAYTDGLTEELNCDPPSLFSGKTRILLHFNIDGTDFVEVYIDQKRVPQFVTPDVTPGPYFKKIADNLLEFDKDYSTASPAQLIEIETFEPATPVATPSMLAGLQLKGRAFGNSDGSGTLYNAASIAPVAGKTTVITDFDILTTDVIFVEVGGVYYPQYIDPVITPGNSWKLIGANSIEFNTDLSSPIVPIDIRVFQGQSFIDKYGNVTIVLKAAMDNIILQSPDTTKWMVGVTNLGELDPATVTIGSPDPIRLKRDGDNVVCSIEIDNLGELSVNDAPSPGILVDTLHLQAPSGMVFRLGINVSSELYLEDGWGNTFTLKNDTGEVIHQINEVVGGMIVNDKYFASKDDLPTPPTLVAGTVPSAKAYDADADRIFEYIYTQGAWRQMPLLEPGTPDVLGVPVGSPFESMLSQAQMDALYGVNKCVIADGRDVSGSRYATITGTNQIPDLRGMYLRGKNNGRTDGFQNPDGDLPLGSYQADQFASHGPHTTIPAGPHVLEEQHGGLDYGVTYTNVGGNETRPRTMTVNIFIRIN